MLKLESITVRYKDKTVLENLSLTATAGEIIGLVAPNGTGKTTLFNVIANFLKPNKGNVTFREKLQYKTEKQEIAIHNQLATLPDQADLFEELSGVEHMKLYADMWNSDKKVEDIYKYLQMEGYVKKKVKTYSLGMRQRLCFAMLACADTPVMLMDEVMNGLDVANVALISRRLAEMKEEGKLLFIASHLLSNLDLYADRVLYLKDGDFIHEQNAQNKDEKYIKLDISPEEYEKLSLVYSLPEDHLYIADHLLCIPTVNMSKEEQLHWMLNVANDENKEVTIGPLGTLEFYEHYYHGDAKAKILGGE
ncbi:ATP-binding cassette domain-containing protein [Oceanobacillus luteolus]|uniref:ATP-binding cassette domain-containing protein n=1 Tax=Oceanobacillus luteolus TaxID=1274358 RepID=A0ABW4HXN5_9BACI